LARAFRVGPARQFMLKMDGWLETNILEDAISTFIPVITL
jgi:hypothetical protein